MMLLDLVCLLLGHRRDPRELGLWSLLPECWETGTCPRCRRRYFRPRYVHE